jgi:hypothetical protein
MLALSVHAMSSCFRVSVLQRLACVYWCSRCAGAYDGCRAQGRGEISEVALWARRCFGLYNGNDCSSERRLMSFLASGRSTSCTSTSRADTERGLGMTSHLHVKPTPTLAGMIVDHTEVEQCWTQPEPQRLNRACQLPALLQPPSVTEASMFAVLATAGMPSCLYTVRQYSTGTDVISMSKMRGA